MKSKIINDTGNGKKGEKNIRSTIICVDDEKMMLSVLYQQLSEWFGSNYRIEKALGGEEALQIIDSCIQEGAPVSVVISDYMMPLMKGDELLIEIQKRDSKIRKIMLTGYTSVSGIITAINHAGLYRFILKPWDVKDLMLTVMEAIKSYEREKQMHEMAKGIESLYRQCEDSTQHLVDALISTMQAVDANLAGHAMRIKQYSVWLANKLELNEEVCKNLKYISVLHEIGKIGRNGGQESQEELLEELDIAKKIISHIYEWEAIYSGVQYQFEKYDGSGLYQLKGKDIPSEARVLAVVHYYDYLRSNPENEQLSAPQIADMLSARKGTHLDPEYVDAFIKILLPVK